MNLFLVNMIVLILYLICNWLDKQKQGASMNQEHKYIKGVQCDDENCYACAKQHKNCNRLDKLDKQTKRSK